MHFGNSTDMKGISQGFSEDGVVLVRYRYLDLKIHASIVAYAFCGLHNGKYTQIFSYKKYLGTIINFRTDRVRHSPTSRQWHPSNCGAPRLIHEAILSAETSKTFNHKG